MGDEANFIAQFGQLLKNWLCYMQSGVVVEKNWALSVDQCQLQALHFSVHLIGLPTFRRNGFAGIQKAVVVRMSSRPPVTMTFFWCKFSALKFLLSPATELVISGCHIKSTFCHTSQFKGENGSLLLGRIREDDTSEQQVFLFAVSS